MRWEETAAAKSGEGGGSASESERGEGVGWAAPNRRPSMSAGEEAARLRMAARVKPEMVSLDRAGGSSVLVAVAMAITIVWDLDIEPDFLSPR